MGGDKTITLYRWILDEFTVEGRADSVSQIGPELAALVRPGDTVLDLCCGAGPFAFYLEEHGAKVTGIDFAPYMIDLAKEEAAKRNSTANFVLGDVLTHDLGVDQFDLVVCLGNTVQDFSPDRFLHVVRKVTEALKPNGRFAIHHLDGVFSLLEHETHPREGVYQEEPNHMTYRHKGYLPEKGVSVTIYRNESSGEEYEYTRYIYTPPLLRLLIGGMLEMERIVTLSEKSFLDIYLKPQGA